MNKITRVKSKDYTTISNVFLRDKELSLKAKGMLSTIMSLPDDWDFSINGICAIVKEGKTAVYSAIDELKEHGYCSVVVCRNERGCITGNDYTFTENPHTENPNMDNQTQLNTNLTNSIPNKGITIDKEINEKEYKEKFAEFVSLYKKMGGKVRGVDTEFDDFKRRHGEWRTIIPYLSLAVQRETKARQQAIAEHKFFPEPKMLQTYLGKQKAWELYVTIGEDLCHEEYTPMCGGALMYNDYYKCYMYTGYWDGHIADGYTDDNRPDGASVTLNNGRGVISWDAETKEWRKK